MSISLSVDKKRAAYLYAALAKLQTWIFHEIILRLVLIIKPASYFGYFNLPRPDPDESISPCRSHLSSDGISSHVGNDDTSQCACYFRARMNLIHKTPLSDMNVKQLKNRPGRSVRFSSCQIKNQPSFPNR